MLPIGTILKDYRLERVLGRGGMGVVFEASHLFLDRRFAIKVLGPQATLETSGMERFKREAQVTSRLGHPHIVEVTDFGITDDGIAYLVMERLLGESLGERLARRGRLTLAETGAVLQQVCSALEAAHRQNVVHRDLKPENILLCQVGERDDYVKVLDFGISKVLNTQTIARGQAPLGSPSYMSPEQAGELDGQVGPATDVYALAAVAFHMLTGAPPFTASNPLALLYKIGHEPPPALRTLRPELPVELEQLLGRALAKDPADRPASMTELWEGFAATLERPAPPEEIPTVTRRTSATVRQEGRPAPPLLVDASSRTSRRRLMALALGLLLVAGVIGAIAFGVGKRPARGRDAAPDPSARAAPPRPPAVAPDAAVSTASPPSLDLSVARSPARPHRRSGRPSGTAQLRVAVRGAPVAEVYVDGRLNGETPFVRRLPAGKHRIVVRTRDGRTLPAKEIVLTPGSVTRLIFP